MIDIIKNKINSSLSSTGNEKVKADTKANDVKIGKIDQKSKANIDSGTVTKFITKDKIKDMAKNPPIDKDSTTRIKQAISSGSYPIDLDKIADALFDAYKEMKD